MNEAAVFNTVQAVKEGQQTRVYRGKSEELGKRYLFYLTEVRLCGKGVFRHVRKSVNDDSLCDVFFPTRSKQTLMFHQQKVFIV